MSALVDIGANLGHKSFRGDLPEVLSRAAEAGVTAIVVTGTSEAASRRAREITLDPGLPRAIRLFSTAGVHPHEAGRAGAGTIAALRDMLRHPEVVVVGECGLDYDRDFSPRDRQRACFEAQLELAAEVQKPVFLHEREAHDDFAAILSRWRPKLVGGVVHCFTSQGRALDRYLEMDLHIGITGFICDERRGRHLQTLVRRVPANRLMVETDAPFLLPRDLPHGKERGRNEPAHVAHVAKAVAACRGEPFAAFAASSTATAQRFFGIG